MAEHTVVAVPFAESSKAYQALSELKNAGAEGRVEVLSAGVVVRDESGAVSIPEGADNVGGSSTIGGSLIGLLVGIIGGPIGMLFGWTTGAIAGGVVDARREDDTEGVLGEISRYIPPGGTAVAAELNEYTVEVVDTLMTALGGTVVRRPAAEVLAELEAAEEAYKAAQKEARKVAKEQRKAERRQNAEERKAALKEKLGIS